MYTCDEHLDMRTQFGVIRWNRALHNETKEHVDFMMLMYFSLKNPHHRQKISSSELLTHAVVAESIFKSRAVKKSSTLPF